MKPTTLVIADDDRSFVEAVSIFLRDHGYHVLTAFTGRDALARLQQDGADLAILDIHLPDISGIDVAHAARQSRQNMPFILISSDDGPDTQARCQADGAWHFLAKPLAPDELLKAIAGTLTKPGLSA